MMMVMKSWLWHLNFLRENNFWKKIELFLPARPSQVQSVILRKHVWLHDLLWNSVKKPGPDVTTVHWNCQLPKWNEPGMRLCNSFLFMDHRSTQNHKWANSKTNLLFMILGSTPKAYKQEQPSGIPSSFHLDLHCLKWTVMTSSWLHYDVVQFRSNTG